MSTHSLVSYFTDPVLRAPTIGSMLMCFAAGVIGVVVLLRKESLIGESLSHATYPGVALGALAALFLTGNEPFALSIGILAGSLASASLGYGMVLFLQNRLNVKSDAALCFVLSSFFAVGIAAASRMQFSTPTLYRQVQTYLYGQAATMTDRHIVLYGLLSLVVIATVALFYKEIKAITLEPTYAKSLGIPVSSIDALVFLLIVLAVVIGIRSVGVVLMSAMLIAPAVAARQLSDRLSLIFSFAGGFGLLSGFLGNFLSLELSLWLGSLYPEEKIGVPTGPMIVLVAAGFSIGALLFAPSRGLVARLIRAGRFRSRCLKENLLKTMWKAGEGAVLTLDEITEYESGASYYFTWLMRDLTRSGWVKSAGKGMFSLTQDGFLRAARVVRLHRLWEVYLVDELGMSAGKVHRSAEEMEHILTPELEKRLTELLDDPKVDPHRQPIPKEERL